LTLAAGEDLQGEILQRCVNHVTADPAALWNIELQITPEVMNANVGLLRENGFEPAGNLSFDTKTLLRFRKRLRRSGDAAVLRSQFRRRRLRTTEE
jgi:hypothetical protein